MRISGFVTALLLAASVAGAQEAEFKLVVNSSVGVSALPHDEVSQIFLKKKTTWPGGQAVTPVDLVDSPTRRAFSKTVLKKEVGAVKSYWQTQIFSGRGVPPPEKGSDAAVLAFVEANAGAIGYVSAGAQVGRGVKEVRVN
jgi:ABC-type phosphate transport system substrate-binding protein